MRNKNLISRFRGRRLFSDARVFFGQLFVAMRYVSLRQKLLTYSARWPAHRDTVGACWRIKCGEYRVSLAVAFRFPSLKANILGFPR